MLNRVARRLGVSGRETLSGFLDAEAVLVPDIPLFHLQESLPEHYRVVSLTEGCYGFSAEASLPHPTWGEGDIEDGGQPILFLSLGSDCRAPAALFHLVRSLAEGAWRLFVSTSGNNGELLRELRCLAPDAHIAPYFQLTPEFARNIDAYLCQGGLGGIYQAIRYALPLFIVPLHPEQDHNGRLVEFHGLGRRLRPSRAFPGQSDLYLKALSATSGTELRNTVESFLDNRASHAASFAIWQAAVRNHSAGRMTLPEAVDHLLHEESACLA